jgi:hypothetical protein
MEAKKILEAIEIAVKEHQLPGVQRGDLKILIKEYQNLFQDYVNCDDSKRKEVFSEVLKQRPLIGKRLQEQFDKDLKNEN